jgi:hypothetical protein
VCSEQLFPSLLYLSNYEGDDATNVSGSGVVLNAPLMYWGVQAQEKKQDLHNNNLLLARIIIKKHNNKRALNKPQFSWQKLAMFL